MLATPKLKDHAFMHNIYPGKFIRFVTTFLNSETSCALFDTVLFSPRTLTVFIGDLVILWAIHKNSIQTNLAFDVVLTRRALEGKYSD